MEDKNMPRLDPALAAGNRKTLAGYQARHFQWEVNGKVATITLNRPERKNPLTFESYAELRDLFGQLRYATDVHAVVVTGAGGNFCSGGDVHEIIGPLVRLKAPELLMFTRMTGDLVQDDAGLPAADRGGHRRRLRRRRRHRGHGVGPAPGHRAQQDRVPVQPRRAGRLRHGRLRHPAAHRSARAARASCSSPAARWAARRASAGASSTGCAHPRPCWPTRRSWRVDLADGPTFANGITKTMLHQEWAMTIEQAIEAEAQAQAICMLTEDFSRAYDAFVAKQKPRFEGN